MALEKLPGPTDTGSRLMYLRPIPLAAVLLTLAVPGLTTIQVTEAVQIVSAPAYIAANSVEDPTAILFPERQNVTLTNPVEVNVTQPGAYDDMEDLGAKGLIDAGTMVSSYLLHFDPVGRPLDTKEVIGSVTFDEPILGLIIFTQDFVDSNAALGAPGTQYGFLSPVDLGATEYVDNFALSADRKTVTFCFRTTRSSDSIRILTTPDSDGDGVPDSEDHCPNTDLRAYVDVNGTKAGVTSVVNRVDDHGCSIQDRVNWLQKHVGNHGEYVTGIRALANQLQQIPWVTSRQNHEMVLAAAGSDIGKN